jgi:hypothetical protein
MSEQPIKRDWFYWFIAAFTAIQLGWGVIVMIDFILHPLASAEPRLGSALLRLISGLVLVPFQLGITLLVLRRAPHNVTGLFLLCWASLFMTWTLRAGSPLEPYNAIALGWIGVWCLPLFFPDGRTFPKRFQSAIRILCVALILFVNAYSFTTPDFNNSSVPNALFVPALEPLFPLVNQIETGLILATIILIVPSVVLRYRQSNLLVRQQLKWLGWIFFVIVASTLLLAALNILQQDRDQVQGWQLLLVDTFTWFVFLAPFIAVGNAILRHKLYDIDIIIRRTLIYTVLTTILGVVYFGGIVLTQQVFRAITGQSSELAIVASTLLIAALFAPLRRCVQDVIDRRLYRKKYDAEKVLADFQKNLREEVDMETLKANLIGVLEDTMQPTKIALWVKEEKS